MKWQTRVAATIAGVALASAPYAVVCYSNFGTNYGYEIAGGWTVSGPTSGFPTQVVAFQFTALASGSLTSVVIPFGHVAGTNIGRVILYDDSGSDTLGNPLIAWTETLAELGEPDLLNLTNSEDTPFLVAGTKYWLGTHYVVDDTWDAWNMTTVTDEQLCGFSYDGGETYNYSMQLPAGAFEINVVPEPVSMAALGLGLGLIALRRKRV
ncbi:MAG: hypothetical protein HONBIEJF_02945 [Fimbriimonadaceae bacterium]|nr:hypothetical protein [Fimbriimonadaceae bacterium]